MAESALVPNDQAFEENPFKEIRKRDGRVVPFDPVKITDAIFKAARAVGAATGDCRKPDRAGDPPPAENRL